MPHGKRATTAAVFLLALSACGGRALLEEGSASGGHSGTLGTGGHSAAGGELTIPQAGGPVVTSGGSSSTTPVCNDLCEAILCTGGNVMTPPGQCCPVCVGPTPPVSDAGPAPPASQCPGLTANPPLVCPLALADVACSSDADCTTKMGPLCGSCVGLVYGVNVTSNSACEPIPCPAQSGTCTTFSFQTQDCLITPKGQDIIGAKCVAGQCKSYAELLTLPP